MYKNLREYLKEATILVILLSLIRQLYYFTSFNVPIKYFLTFSEIWMVLINDMWYLLLFAVYILFFYLFIPDEKDVDDVIIDKYVKVIFVVICGILIISGLCILFIKTEVENKIIGTYTVLLSIVGIILFYSLKHIRLKRFFIILFAMLTFLFFLISTNKEIGKVKRGRYKGTIISTKDTSYLSTDSTFFIGKTEDYIFIHNLKDSSTDIIPTSSVTNIKMKMK